MQGYETGNPPSWSIYETDSEPTPWEEQEYLEWLTTTINPEAMLQASF